MLEHFEWKEGDKSEAVCPTCKKLTTTTFKPDDLEMNVGGAVVLVRGLLLGICDKCGKPASVPAQSTAAVREAIGRTIRAKEMNT